MALDGARAFGHGAGMAADGRDLPQSILGRGLEPRPHVVQGRGQPLQGDGPGHGVEQGCVGAGAGRRCGDGGRGIVGFGSSFLKLVLRRLMWN